MGVHNVLWNGGSRFRPIIRPLRLSSIAVVLAASVVGAFWLVFIWVAVADREDAMDDAGDNLSAFVESYAEFAATLAQSGVEIPLGEREAGIAVATTKAAAALDSFHLVAQPDEGVKLTIRHLARGTEGIASQYRASDLQPYRYIGNRLFSTAQRPEAGFEVVAEETDIEAIENWRETAFVEILVLGMLTAMITSLAFWFFRYLRAHEAMEAQNAKLQSKLLQSEKIEAIGTLAGGVAHELNNLLQPIIMMTELVLADLPEDSNNARQLHRVVDAGAKAAEIVQRILAFGRADEVSNNLLDMGLVAREGSSFIRTILPSSITLHVEIADSVGMVRGDKTQLTQVLINLATNARDAIGANIGTVWVSLSKANARGGASLSAVAVGTLGPGAHAVITVRDTGAGMDKATVERIFEPFFTTKGVGKGTGLGLSVMHGIVVRHGGAVQVDSTPGRGTSFSIYLPIAEIDLPIALAG